MIAYRRGKLGFVKILQFEGSVFPFSFWVAFPCSALTAILRVCIEHGWVPQLGDADDSKTVLKDNTCWSGFVFLVGFLVVFRTSQAYARFWDGCTSTHQMRAEWFDACSALVAFCKFSKAPEEKVLEFQHILIRLFSMLHAVALADIEDTCADGGEVAAFKYELVDARGLSPEALRAVRDSDAKVELVFQWIQQLIVENIETGVLHIPPPILSRAFQEIANGMVAFHEAIKISTIPFPFPYAQTCECLLLMHWVCTPLVVAQWVSTPWWGALFSFITVFIYWSLNSIATEIENPFGSDANDIDAEGMQLELNRHLLLLLEPEVKIAPCLTADVQSAIRSKDDGRALTLAYRETSLEDVWVGIDGMATSHNVAPMRTLRATVSRSIDVAKFGGMATVARHSHHRMSLDMPGCHSKNEGHHTGRLSDESTTGFRDPIMEDMGSSWGRRVSDKPAHNLRTVNEEDGDSTGHAERDGNYCNSESGTPRCGTPRKRFGSPTRDSPRGEGEGASDGSPRSEVRPGSPGRGAQARQLQASVQGCKHTRLAVPKYNPPRG